MNSTITRTAIAVIGLMLASHAFAQSDLDAMRAKATADLASARAARSASQRAFIADFWAACLAVDDTGAVLVDADGKEAPQTWANLMANRSRLADWCEARGLDASQLFIRIANAVISAGLPGVDTNNVTAANP